MIDPIFSMFIDKWVHPDYRPIPILAEALDRVEDRFQTRLPESYRNFMESVGPASADLSLLTTIVDNRLDLPDLQEFFSPEVVVEQTTMWRTIGLSKELIAFAGQGAGDMFCFEVIPKFKPASEELNVWYFNHEEREAYDLEITFLSWVKQYAELPKTGA
jgi:SMI1-KNR4 cell-wall